MAQLTKQIILEAAEKKNINPYKQPFVPKELGLRADKYGAFADYCNRNNTKSGKWNKSEILTAVEFNKGNRPTKYLLK